MAEGVGLASLGETCAEQARCASGFTTPPAAGEGALERRSNPIPKIENTNLRFACGLGFSMAEGVGFEPTEPFGSAVFKTAAFNRSATPPGSVVRRRHYVRCGLVSIGGLDQNLSA